MGGQEGWEQVTTLPWPLQEHQAPLQPLTPLLLSIGLRFRANRRPQSPVLLLEENLPFTHWVHLHLI